MSDFENQEKMRKYYDQEEYFDESIKTPDDLLKSPFQKYRIVKITQLYSTTKQELVLDLGCALGTFCFAFAPQCKQITGLDYSKRAIETCNRLLKTGNYNNINFVCADAQNTGLVSESFDVIICADLLEHLFPDVSGRVLDECNRVLKKNGKLIIWTPNRGHILEIMRSRNIILKKFISHVDYKSMDYLLNALRKRNFSITKSYYTESHLPIFRIVEKMLLCVVPMMRRRIAILAKKD